MTSTDRRYRARHRRAFTLIEAIASMVVLATLGSVASMILLTASDSYLGANTGAQLHGELSVAMDRIVREFMRIPLDTSASETAPYIDAMTTTSIQWRNSDDEACSLELNATNLMLAMDGGPDLMLLSDVSFLTLRAYDEDNAAMGASLSGGGCDAIRRIEITITLTRHGVSDTLRTRVFLRNTMRTTP